MAIRGRRALLLSLRTSCLTAEASPRSHAAQMSFGVPDMAQSCAYAFSRFMFQADGSRFGRAAIPMVVPYWGLKFHKQNVLKKRMLALPPFGSSP